MNKIKFSILPAIIIILFWILAVGNNPVLGQNSHTPGAFSSSPDDDNGYLTPLDPETPGATPSEAPVATPQKDPVPTPTLSEEERKAREESRKELAKKIESYVKNDEAWSRARVGLYFTLAENGDVLFSQNPNLPMIPASTLKLVTTASALSLLGPDYRFRTAIWGGDIDKSTGIMTGNLYLEGSGDPTFMDPFTDNSTETLHSFAAHLRKMGVTRIEGDLVGDDSAFDREFLGRGWKPRYLMYDYAAPAGGLSINGNCVRLIIQGGTVSMLPGNRYIQIIYDTQSRGELRVSRTPGTDRVNVAGSSGGTAYRNITINNPSMFTTAVFARVLEGHGITIDGKARLVDSGDTKYREYRRQIAFHRSPPLHEIVREINKESDNICAQHVFKAIGHQVKGKGTCDNSNDAIKEFFTGTGIDVSCFAMADGSGLSVYNRITPRQLNELLRYMKTHQHWEHFWKSLPVAGVDGTLVYRMKGAPVRAKTGGLQGHIALSGYVTTKAGQQIVFVMFTNRHQHWGSRIRQNEDYILNILSGWNKLL